MNRGKNKEEEIVETGKKRALLLSTYQGPQQRAICEEHLQELALLVETYGAEPVGQLPCQLRKYDAATYLSQGKLQEALELAKELKAELVIFDEEISPAQQRNLEKIFELPIMDRTEVILEVFAHRAQTHEARLQIELARIKYEAPRLKRLWTHLSRQHGTGGGSGGAYLKGEGEKQIEIDRRILKRKIEGLQKEIEDVKGHRITQRSARVRAGIPTFAIIGYTNAGKSTLLNALTDAGVFVEDKLFATLDTTTRKFTLPNNQEILLIDTVGFIRKLPHQLVAAFKSTLEEATQADILLHLMDANHHMVEEQATATYEVLKELGAHHKPMIHLLNKCDLIEESGKIARLRLIYPKSVVLSALKREGFEELYEKMIQELRARRCQVTLRIPQSRYALVSEVMRQGQVLQQEYEEDLVILQAEIPQALASKLQEYLVFE